MSNLSDSSGEYFQGKKSYPSPIVSLGKILGYKLARKVDVFNELVSKTLGRQDVATSNKETAASPNVQTTIINVFQQRSDGQTTDGSSYNRNLNAMQDGQTPSTSCVYRFINGQPVKTPSTEDTNVNATLRQELARQRLASARNARHRTPNTRPPRSDTSTRHNRSRIAKKFPHQVKLYHKLNSVSKKRDAAFNRTQRRQSQSKPRDSTASTSRDTKGAKNGSPTRPATQKTRSPSCKRNKEQKLLSTEQEKKNRQIENHRNELLKCAEKEWPHLKTLLQDSTRNFLGNDEVPLEKRVGSKTSVERTPMDKGDDKKRRYAEVAAGYSKSGSDKEHGHLMTVCPDVQPGDKTQIKTSRKNKARDTLVNEVTKTDNSRKQASKLKATPQTWASVAEGTTCSDDIHGSHGSKMITPLTDVSVWGRNLSFDFPTLEESKGKRQVKDKCRNERLQVTTATTKQSDKSHVLAMHNQFYRDGDSPARNKSQREKKKDRNMKSKLRARMMSRKGNVEDPKALPSSPQRTTAKQHSSTGSWYIDNIQEVVIQPVGIAVPLHNETNKESQQTNLRPVSVSFATSSSMDPNKTPMNQTQLKFDLCNELDAMSVTSSSDASLDLRCKRKKTAKPSSPAAQKNIKIRTQKDSKSKREEPCASPKRISARYRALLRRDLGKIDAKTATEIINRDKRIDSPQKSKKVGRFDHLRQMQNKSNANATDTNACGRGMSPSVEGTSNS